VTDLLLACGVAPDSVHTGKTARRVRDLWENRLLGGYEMDPGEALGEGFADPREDMVVVRGIAVHGVCPHHLVPFRGVAHVAYVPGGRLHGFGRIARLVDAIGHRFTYQEWMTRDIVDALITHGRAKGAACVIEAEQLCLSAGRGPARRRAGRDPGILGLLPAGCPVAQRVPAGDHVALALSMRDLAIRPRTLVPPPLVYALALGAAWWLDGHWSLAFETGVPARMAGWGLIGIGLAGFVWALAAIWGHHTTVNPYKAASNLVTRGPFALSRNPIYVSDWFVYLGVTLLLGTIWPLVFCAPSLGGDAFWRDRP
jgi:GTP cyclohydrolase I